MHMHGIISRNNTPCIHRPSSSYIHSLYSRAAALEPALEEIEGVSALERLPIAEMRDDKGIIFCDIVDTYAFLEWLVFSRDSEAHFLHRRLRVLQRTLIHEGIEWMCRRLNLYPQLDSYLHEFLAHEKIADSRLRDLYRAEYDGDMENGPDAIFHLFAEFCDDLHALAPHKHIPDGHLSAAGAFLFDSLAGFSAFGPVRKRLEKQMPELPEEAYFLEDTGDAAPALIRGLMEKRGLRVAPVTEIRKIDAEIARLNSARQGVEERDAAIADLAKCAPGMEALFDIFGITTGAAGALDEGRVAAIRSRILSHISPASTPRRIGVVGYDQNIIAALRRIVTVYSDYLEIVVFLGQKLRDIMQWIKYNSQLGIFEEVRADERGFLYLGKQKSAVGVYHGRLSEPSAVLQNFPWKALGITCVMIGENQARRITQDARECLLRDGVELVVARAEANNAPLVQKPAGGGSFPQKALGVLPSEDIAYALGISVLAELGNICVAGADVVEKHDEPTVVQPTYRVPGVYQLIHRKNPERFGGLAERLGLVDASTRFLATNEFKTNIPRGKLLRINAVIGSRVSREGIVALFEQKTRELDFLELPEWWAQLTSNLNFGNPKIVFDPNQVYVSQNDAGTQVSVAFFIDEAVADIDAVLRTVSGCPTRKEQAKTSDPFAVGMPFPCRTWAGLDIAQQSEFSQRHIPALAQKYSRKSEANAIRRRARRYAAQQAGDGRIAICDARLTDDAMRLLFLESQPILRHEVLRDESQEAVAIVALHQNRHKLYSTPLLTTASLHNVQHAMGRYYNALRAYALDLSREYDWEILIHDVYEHGHKLRTTTRIHHLDYNEKKGAFERMTLVSVDQYDRSRQRWRSISRPNTDLYPSPPSAYNIVINGPGGRIGSCTLRLAAKSQKLRVVAVGGPDAKRLAELLNGKDYVQGRYPGTVEYGEDWIELDGNRILVFSHPVFRDPASYPWKCFILAGIPIHVAIDATGRFNTVDGVNRHRRAGALRAMITAPGSSKEDEWRDCTFIRHINDHKYDPSKHFFLSPASCTTGCLANLNRLIEVAMYLDGKSRIVWDDFYKEASHMVLEGIGPTYHSLTGEHIGPDIIDPIEYRKDIRRGTDATGNIFETTSGASASTALVDAAGVSHTPVYSIRFPIETVSVMAPTYVLRGHYTIEHIEAASRALEEACRVGEQQRFQFIRSGNIDRSTQIRLLRELAEAGATLCKDNVEIIHFTASSGQPMTVIQLIAWYENEWRPSKMYIEFLEEVMLPAENKFRATFTGFPYVTERFPKHGRPYTRKASLLDLPNEAFDGKYWLIRVDHNVVDPLYDPDTNRVKPFINDDHRILASASDIGYLIQRNARVIVLSHNGRRKDFQFLQSEDGQVIEQYSLKIAAQRLAHVLQQRGMLDVNRDFFLAPGVVDAETARLSRNLKPGQVLYVDNLRFHEGEESGNRHFAKALFDTFFGHLDAASQGATGYANSAFGASHRGLHASFLPLMNLIRGHKVMGLLSSRELDSLDRILENPKRPVAAFVSGAKMAEKIPALEAMIRHGAIQTLFSASPAFLVASGKPAGNSMLADDPMEVELEIAAAHRLIEVAAEFNVDVKLPDDLHVGLAIPDKFRPKKAVPSRVVRACDIPFGSSVYDIAPVICERESKTGDAIKTVLKDAKTVIYNGTVGLYEVEQFSAGTNWLVDAIAASRAEVRLAVGGDGVAAINRRLGGSEEAEKIFTVCTGGGAALKYLATQALSAFDGLDDRTGEDNRG